MMVRTIVAGGRYQRGAHSQLQLIESANAFPTFQPVPKAVF
jgi:hypothetical protein